MCHGRQWLRRANSRESRGDLFVPCVGSFCAGESAASRIKPGIIKASELHAARRHSSAARFGDIHDTRESAHAG
jgi:hypothetical protein